MTGPLLPGAPAILTPAALAERMRERRPPADSAFDRFLGSDLQRLSEQHWTPLRVASHAALWFRTFGIQSIVDVGSGAGKFCVAAAMACEASFTGVERRAELVQESRRLADLFGLTGRVEFREADVGIGEPPPAHAYYLFNPFAENIFGSGPQVAPSFDMGHARYLRDVRATRCFLADRPTGTYVLTYHGYGSTMPPGFEVVCADRTSYSGALRLWQKKRKRPSSGRSPVYAV